MEEEVSNEKLSVVERKRWGGGGGVLYNGGGTRELVWVP